MTTTQEKIEAFVAGLDDDERGELAAVDPAASKDELSAGLREKVQSAADGLTAEDRAEVLAVINSDEEVEGFTWVSRDHRGQQPIVRDHRQSSQPSFLDQLADPYVRAGRSVYQVISGYF